LIQQKEVEKVNFAPYNDSPCGQVKQHSIQGEAMKKTYEKPTIVHTEKLEARAVACAKADSSTPTCSNGPIQS
jgi:hypothetical protein